MSADCTIIIPAFNASETIQNALDSIELDKHWKHQVEVIVVDDGSIDNTFEVVSTYAKNHSEITIISHKNAGVSTARNEGIKAASAEYLFFMDADDTIYRKTLEKMIEIARHQSVDLVIADYYQFDTVNGIKEIYRCDIPCDTVLSAEYLKTVFERYFTNRTDGLANLWNKLFTNKILQENGIRFDERRTHGEDWAFCISYFRKINSLYAVNDIIYEYRLDGSQNRSKYRRELAYCLLDGNRIVNELNNQYLHHEKCSEEYFFCMKSFYFQIIGYLKMDIDHKKKVVFLREKEVKDCLNYFRLQNRETLLNADLSRKDKLAVILLSLGIYKPVIHSFY